MTSAPDSSVPWTDLQKQVHLEMLARVLDRHPRAFLSYKEALKLVQVVDRESQRHNVDPLRMLALIVVESAGQPRIVSSSGALGLMQLLPETGEFIAGRRGEAWRGDKSLFEVDTNVKYGVWYYSHLRDTFGGDVRAALAAYNWGPYTILERQKAGEKLPVIYADRVAKEEAWLDREWRKESGKHFWDRVRELQQARL